MRKLVATLPFFDAEPFISHPWASGSPLHLQGLLLLYGAYLAGLTDHVSSPPVNQSLTIMVGVNLMVLAAGLLFVVTRYLHSWPNLVFGLTSGGIFVCTTTINCFIFIPQVCSRENLARPVLLVTPEAVLGMINCSLCFLLRLWGTIYWWVRRKAGSWWAGSLYSFLLRKIAQLPVSKEGRPEGLSLGGSLFPPLAAALQTYFPTHHPPCFTLPLPLFHLDNVILSLAWE